MGSLFSSSANKSSSQGQSQSTSTPFLTIPGVKEGLEELVSRSRTASNQPYEAYTKDLVAGFTPDQLAAMSKIRDTQGTGQNYLTRAADLIGAGTYTPDQWNQDAYSRYKNPFEQSVVDQSIKDMERTAAIQGMDLRSAATKGGAFGGARYAIAGQELGRNLNDTLTRNLADLRSTGYNTAYNEFSGDQNRKLAAAGLNQSAGQGFSGLASLAQNLTANDIQNLMTSGGMQQALNQAGLQTEYGKWAENRNWDKNNLSWLASIMGTLPYSSITGNASNTTTTQQATTPGPSLFSQIAGAGLAGAGLANLGAFNGLGGIFSRMFGGGSNMSPVTAAAANQAYYNPMGS